MASPGYGKRSAPGQNPPHADDFAQLPAREAYLARLVDRLPEGAAMDTKTLAREQPHYGQQAVRSALNRLSVAGHLRRVRERVDGDRTQWVFRTYFSRTPRDDAWWSRFLTVGDTDGSADTGPAQVHPDERPHPRVDRSPAYRALAALGLADPRLALSARDCDSLEPLAAQWLARGAGTAYLTTALTAGLPPAVHSPAAFVHRRLADKMPPERTGEPTAPVTRVLECTDCRTPSRPQALLGGLCRACRAGASDAPPPRTRLSPQAVHRHAARVRASVRPNPSARHPH
ncbi:hypothetical protein ACIF6L_18455 [Kitasatospora sp. NPDC086009]|uniref:hypothetical protein n=1 Tax=unclassified Kitasatospora TaxID=2633591 RepID=UPI0037C8D320